MFSQLHYPQVDDAAEFCIVFIPLVGKGSAPSPGFKLLAPSNFSALKK